MTVQTEQTTILLDDWHRMGTEILETFNLTHCGILPGDDNKVVMWGLRYPDLHLLVFMDFNDSSKPPTPIIRVGWERLTSWPPPWPWSYDGLIMKIL